MDWQFATFVGFAVFIILFIVAFSLYSNLRGLYNVAQRVLRLRSDRTRARSVTDTRCLG